MVCLKIYILFKDPILEIEYEKFLKYLLINSFYNNSNKPNIKLYGK